MPEWIDDPILKNRLDLFTKRALTDHRHITIIHNKIDLQVIEAGGSLVTC